MTQDNTFERHENLTQKYATWGDKLLQHADVLYSMQVDKVIKPITIQLAPVENCDSSCNFCSVSGRPLRARMKWSEIEQVLRDFKTLGAKSLEITGGGNPLLYKDIDTGKNINDIIRFANSLGYHIGIITNSEKLTKLSRDVYDMISWIRVSLIKLDEGKEPEDYDFAGFPYEKLGFSYIIYDKGPSPVTGRQYSGTSEYTIQRIARLVELHGGGIKFVRFAGNCLIKGNNSLVRKKLSDVIDANDKYKKFFLKTIEDTDSPYNDGCYVGMIRPYVAPSPDGIGYNVYACTSHVLNSRTYDVNYALCKIEDIIPAWAKMNENFREKGYPYEIKGNCGTGWCSTCTYCYYRNNNRILHTVAQKMPDGEFP